MDYVIRPATQGVHWPGLLPYRSRASAKGYKTAEEAQGRINVINSHYNATKGCGVDLRIEERSK